MQKNRVILKLMPILVAILAFVALAGASLFGLGPTGEKLIEPIGPPGYGGPVCLSESSITDEVVLSQFPKATEVNAPFPNSDRCSGGGCEGADFDDYVKIIGAESVVVDKIWPHEPTTRLFKQILPTDTKYDPYRDVVYRASCNDWCLLDLPYGGSFHCDFIFLLKDRGNLIDRGGELYPKDCENPDDSSTCSVFTVLFRKNAQIPDKSKCNGESHSHFQNLVDQVFAQEESFIYIAGESYILSDEEPITLVKIDMRSQANGRTKVTQSITFRGEQYEAFKNLTEKIDLTDDFLYLTEPGKVDQADLSSDQFFKFQYLEFRKTPPKRPGAKTLQLGTFPVPVGKGWWRKWVDESKPAIYLYPEKPTRLQVILNPAGELTITDPPYDPETGWEILAHPNGTLEPITYNLEPRTYPYLFYEAKLEKVFIKPEGFIISGHNLVNFFKGTFPKLGLNQKETQDFIDYWMTRLNENQPYYFIHFLDEAQIEELEPLEITCSDTLISRSPDTLNQPITDNCQPTTTIRLRPYFKPLQKWAEIVPQTLPSPPPRKGFTLVEWGGILDE